MEVLLQRICVEVVVPASRAPSHRDALAAALCLAWQALRDPDCMPLLGPCVPGATLPLGARVPGTSLELDPPAAAFNLGAMLGAAPGGSGDLLAVLLPAADYAARRAHYHGVPPPTVADLFAALERALAFERSLAADAQCVGDPWLCQRVAGAFVATGLLGGDAALRFAAARDASFDGSPLGAQATRHATPRQRRWAAGENAARALRHALLALRAADPVTGNGTASDGGGIATPRAQDLDGIDVVAADAALARAASLAAAAAAVYPAAQARAIVALFGPGTPLETLAVDDFVARLVRN